MREPPRHADDSSYAWYQSFNNGNQNNNHMDNKLRGCAVRRSMQTGPCWGFFFEVLMLTALRRFFACQRWMRDYERGLNRRAQVETELFEVARGVRPLPDREQCRQWAIKLGAPL